MSGFGTEALRAGMHGVAQGGLGAVQGDNFFNGFASGAISSIASSGFQSLDTKFTNSMWGGTSFGALSGGVGAELSGGDFWRGAGVGATVSLLNHYMHQVEGEWNEKRASNKRAKAYAEEAFSGISLANHGNGAFSLGFTVGFSTPFKGPSNGGFGFSVGKFTGSTTRGIYLTLMKGRGVALSASFDATYYKSLNGRNITLGDLAGDGFQVDFGAAFLGYSLASNAYYKDGFKPIAPTYRSHTLSVSNGMDVGYSDYKSKTYVFPIIPWIGLLIPKIPGF
ncbi:hypothetical protein ACT3CE_13610 [Marinifilum sp. RC60d5]|uniref:hypothetical protein n=1 Tax=Marinifilum sp. RC60d5 TaxID=3458414 RepID=UPI0040361997